MKRRRITGYEREVADRLKHTYLPFSYKIAHFVLDENIGDIDLLRILAEMENIDDEYEADFIYACFDKNGTNNLRYIIVKNRVTSRTGTFNKDEFEKIHNEAKRAKDVK